MAGQPPADDQPRSQAENLGQVFARAFGSLNPHSAVPPFDVEFRPFPGLRSTIRFDPVSERITVRLSDLVKTAPAAALAGLAAVLLGKLYQRRVPAAARAAYLRWAGSQATEEAALESIRERSQKRMRPPLGRAHDLDALFDELNERYFGNALRKPRLGWSPKASHRKMGHYDRAHDAIVISRKLDDPQVPRLALEYVLFHEMLHVKHPVQRRGRRRVIHPPAFLEDERRFQGYEEARDLLLSL